MESYYLHCKGDGTEPDCQFHCQLFKQAPLASTSDAGSIDGLSQLCLCGHKRCDHAEVVMWKNDVSGQLQPVLVASAPNQCADRPADQRRKDGRFRPRQYEFDESEEFEDQEREEEVPRRAQQNKPKRRKANTTQTLTAPFSPPSARIVLPDLSAAVATPASVEGEVDDGSAGVSSSSTASSSTRAVTPIPFAGVESMALTPLVRSAPTFTFAPAGAALAPGESVVDRREMAAVNMRQNFGSLFASQRTYNRVILLDLGTKAVPQRDSPQKRVVAYGSLRDRGMLTEASLTLLATDFQHSAAVARTKMVSHLAVLGQLLAYSATHGGVPVFQFVQKTGRTSNIDEPRVRYTNVEFPPDLTCFTAACNHPNSTDLSIYLRLMVPWSVLTNSSAIVPASTLPSAPHSSAAAAATTALNLAVPAPPVLPVLAAQDPITTQNLAETGPGVPPPLPAYYEQLLPDDAEPVLVDLTVPQAMENVALSDEYDPFAEEVARSFSLSRYLNDCFPTCPQYRDDPVQVNVQAGGGIVTVDPFVQITQHITRSDSVSLHRTHKFTIVTHGVQGVAVDAGGIRRHVFSEAGNAAFARVARQSNGRRLFVQRSDGLLVPSSLPTCIADTSFWHCFGTLLYFAFISGEWLQGLHCSVIKFILDEPVSAADLVGHSACFDRALSVEGTSELLFADDPHTGTIVNVLRELGVDVLSGSNLHQLKKLLVETVLTTSILAALMQIKVGFLSRADATLLTGTETRAALSFAYFQGQEQWTRTVADLEASFDGSVDKNARSYRLLLGALKHQVNTDKDFATKFMCWLCGNAALPPEEPLKLRAMNPAEYQNRLPVAHTCTSTIDLCMPRYVGEEGPAVQLLASDLALAVSNNATSLQLL